MEKEQSEIETTAVVYFDSSCILCNKSVAFILKWEKGNTLRFSSLNFINNPGTSVSRDTIAFKESGRFYYRSTAVLKLSKYLRGIFPVMQILLLIPEHIRDKIYDIVAKRRYRWFGRTETCIVLTDKTRDRFIF